MNKKRWLTLSVGLSFAIVLMSYFCNSGTGPAQECRVVRIIGMAIHDSIRVEPETLTVSKGIAWFGLTGHLAQTCK